MPYDVGWRDPENAPVVGAEPGGRLCGAQVWCLLTCVGRSHHEDAYLVQRYGDANETRKCPGRTHTYWLTLVIKPATSVRSVMASSGIAVVSSSFSKAVSIPTVRAWP